MHTLQAANTQQQQGQRLRAAHKVHLKFLRQSGIRLVTPVMQTAPASHLLQAAGHKVAELLRVLVLMQLRRLLLDNEVEQVPEAQLGLEPWPCTALHKAFQR